jgi:hypothetical protein
MSTAELSTEPVELVTRTQKRAFPESGRVTKVEPVAPGTGADVSPAEPRYH